MSVKYMYSQDKSLMVMSAMWIECEEEEGRNGWTWVKTIFMFTPSISDKH